MEAAEKRGPGDGALCGLCGGPGDPVHPGGG